MEARYTLNCDNCRRTYYSNKAFPKLQYCNTCLTAYKVGMKEVVGFLNKRGYWGKLFNGISGAYFADDNIFLICKGSMWQSQLKEWGIEA